MTLRHPLPALLLLVLTLLSARSFSAGSVPLQGDEMRLHQHLDYLEDPLNQLDLDHVRQAGAAWTRNTTDTAFNRGYSSSTWWLRVRLSNPGQQPLPRLLEVGYAALDHVDVFVLENDRKVEQYVMGDALPFAHRPVDHRFFMAPITWQPAQTLDVYLRIRSNGTIQVPLTLWDYARFHSANNVHTLLEGIYFGGMAAIALYNLLIFFVLRDHNYLIYVAFMTCTAMALASQSGLAFRYLWSNAMYWNNLAILFFTGLTALFATLFSMRFLEVKLHSRRLAQLLKALGIVSVGLVLLCFVMPYQTMGIAILLHMMATVVAMVATGIFAWRRGVPSARIYLIAWATLLVGASVVSLSRLGLAPANVFTEYSAQWGSLVECILLSLALANRINSERKLRFQAQADALKASQDANAALEQRVQERTEALEQLNRQLQQLSETDQLTGLANRRFLENRLQAEWARCLRQKRPLTVMLLDVDHFKQVNDRYGHPAGDACLQQVAALMLECLRWPSDVAARYGGEEFCMILPETDAHGASKVAERIRTQVASALINTDGVSFRVSVSIGLYAGVPIDECPPATFIHRADAALYQSKLSGRDRVTVAV